MPFAKMLLQLLDHPHFHSFVHGRIERRLSTEAYMEETESVKDVGVRGKVSPEVPKQRRICTKRRKAPKIRHKNLPAHQGT